MSKNRFSRRLFLAGTAASAAAIAGCKTGKAPGIITSTSPNEKLNIAAIGSGGKGSSDIQQTWAGKENVVALCDVDWNRAADTFKKFPDAPKFKDYRVMLDKMGGEIDACTVSTSDHMHAPIAMACMERGIHVYVQKPLTHTVWEARQLLKAARKYKVATQMGNQGHSGEGVRRMCEMVWAGIAGDITEVHIWTNRPVWPQGIKEPLPEQPIPETMSWDLWVGAAPMRPYNEGYAPFKWRGWWDFGCGALGDMACHIMDPAFWALDLSNPISVECLEQTDKNDQTGPTNAIVKYEFPERYNKYAKKNMCACTVYWYEGGLQPERPAGVPENEKLGDGDNGSMFIGTNGTLTTGCYGDHTRLVPLEQMRARKEDIANIPKTLPRVEEGHYRSWVTACKTGQPSASNFEYAVPLTETVLLGNLAMRSGKKVLWDAEKMKVLNNDECDAQQYVSKDYRRGFEV